MARFLSEKLEELGQNQKRLLLGSHDEIPEKN